MQTIFKHKKINKFISIIKIILFRYTYFFTINKINQVIFDHYFIEVMKS